MSADFDHRVVNAVGAAYYARAAAAPDQARSRAQNGFAIASFLAGGLVGVGLLSRSASVPFGVRIVGAGALAAWVAGATLYARAVAEPVTLKTGMQPNAADFVTAVLVNAQQERDKIDARRRLAQLASMAASALTAIAVALALLLTPGQATQSASVIVTAQGAAAVRILCGTEARVVHGQLDTASLDSRFISLRLDLPGCTGKELHLPGADVAEVMTGS
jgi:uncharacterized membrane protein